MAWNVPAGGVAKSTTATTVATILVECCKVEAKRISGCAAIGGGNLVGVEKLGSRVLPQGSFFRFVFSLR